jgi:AcrR family transcriptional regulator
MTGPVRAGTRERSRRGEGERLRTEIVAAAERLLRSESVEALSLRAVAREVGVSAPALYLHFADRRALVWAVLEHQFAELTTAATSGMTSATNTSAEPADPRGRLRGWCLAYCRFGLANPGHYRAMFESWAAERVDLPLAELPGHDLWQSLLGAVAACGVPDSERDELGILTWAGLHGLVSLRINKPSFPWPQIERLVDGHLRRLLAG